MTAVERVKLSEESLPTRRNGPQVRSIVIEAPSADVLAAGERLGRAIIAQAEPAPRCPCGAAASAIRTKVEMVGSTIAVDLHLRCSKCASQK